MELSTCLVGGVQPLQLPWKWNSLNRDGIGSARGIAMSVGNPQQFFSLKAVVDANNTALVNVNLCGSVSNYSCVTDYHGVYAPPAGVNSTTQISSWNGTKSGDVMGSAYDYVFFNDVFDLGGKKVPGVPFYTYTQRSNSASGSGLAIGQNSSFMDSMIAAQAIPNKAWSFWPGLQFDTADGRLIMGGYDKSQATGSFSEFNVVNGGKLQIEITSLRWDSLVGTTIDLMPDGASRIFGALEPYYERTGLPPASYIKFYQATNGSVVRNTRRYWPQKPRGNLVVTLSNGITAKIPDDELFYNPFNWNERGTKNVTAYDIYDCAMFSDTTYSTDGLTMGHPYLAQYLLVTNFDRGKFWMANAIKQSTGATATNVQTLCTGGPNNPTPSPGSNVAAIAGGVGGGVGALIIAAIVFCLYRRRKNKNSVQEQPPAPLTTEKQAPPMAYYEHSAVSPPSKHATVYEMDKGLDKGLSPHASSYGSPPGSPLASPPYSASYMPYNRSYDPNNHELPGLNIAPYPNRHSNISPPPQEMPGDERHWK